MSTVTPMPQPRGLKATLLGEVKAWMGRRGINQSELAIALGSNQSQLSKRLRGLITLDVDEIEDIARVLDVDPIVFIHPSTTPWPNGPHGSGPDGGSRVMNGYRTMRLPARRLATAA